MRFLRTLLKCLGAFAALLLLLLSLAYTPAVQTWYAQSLLDRIPGFHGTVGSLSAGLDSVELEDLRGESGGAILTLPTLKAGLPVPVAWRDHKFQVRSLVAKGWTLDLSHPWEPTAGAKVVVETPHASGATPAAWVQVAAQAARLLHGLVRGPELPGDVTLDNVDLEGDILVAAADKAPTRIHVTLKGGGLAAGHEGNFTCDAVVVDPWFPANTVAAHGRLVAGAASPRALDHLSLVADLSGLGGTLPVGLVMTVSLAAAREAEGETYALEVDRTGRHVLSVHARHAAAAATLAGDWKLDLRSADLALLQPDHELPAVVAAGAGSFEADPAFNRTHATGRLEGSVDQLGTIDPSLAQLGAVTFVTRFDGVHSGQSLQVDTLDFTLASGRISAAAHALQRFTYDGPTGELKPADPGKDWLDGSIRGFPMAWLRLPNTSLALSGGEGGGDFTIRLANGAYEVRPKAPFTATGVAVQRAGRTWVQNLDLTFTGLAGYGPDGWQVQMHPLLITAGGRRLASVDGKLTRHAGSDQPVAISAQWACDVDALATRAALPALAGFTARSAKGEITASVGSPTQFELKLALAGHDPLHTCTASVHGDIDAGGMMNFAAPVKLATGKETSELTIEGTWVEDPVDNRINVRVTGETITLDHLRQLAAPGAAAMGLSSLLQAGAVSDGTARPTADRLPFWGHAVGALMVAFDQVKVGDKIYNDVGGTLEFDHGSLHLAHGRGGLPRHHPLQAEGQVTFDAAAKVPYHLEAKASYDDIDLAPLLPSAEAGAEATLEGKGTATGTFTGEGLTLTDLVARARVSVQLTSTTGILRLLRTEVADAIPEEKPSAMKDSLGTVGSAVGHLFGVKGPIGAEKHLGKGVDAVLNFTSVIGEIGYDQLTITAVREGDGRIRLADIALTAPDERITGTGLIAAKPGVALSAQPLQLELKLAVRGKLVEQLKPTGLLSPRKDALGYTEFSQPIHFGGSLRQVDGTAWHDQLVQAMLHPPAAAK